MATSVIVLWTLLAALVLASVLMPMLYLNWRLRAENRSLSEALDDAMARISELEAQLGELKKEPSSKRFSEVVDRLATAGIPGLIFLALLASSPYFGAAAITSTLGLFGGPFGMLAGTGVLVATTALLSRSPYTIADLSKAVVGRLLRKKSKREILEELDSGYRYIPRRYRSKAKELLR